MQRVAFFLFDIRAATVSEHCEDAANFVISNYRGGYKCSIGVLSPAVFLGLMTFGDEANPVQNPLSINDKDAIFFWNYSAAEFGDCPRRAEQGR